MRLSSAASGSPAEGERIEILCNGWQNESLHSIIKRLCVLRDLREYSRTETFARVSKKGTHASLPAHGAPNRPLRTFYETISEGNRTVVSQTDSASIFPQRLKQKKRAKQDEWFFKSEPFLHLGATRRQNLWVCWSWGINAGSTHGQLQQRELSRSYWGAGGWMVMFLFTSCAL